jgi:outer membrane immunogenic protein
MRARYFISTAILAALIAPAAPAVAADYFGPLRGTQYGGPTMTPVVSWQGGYFGGTAGAVTGNASFSGSLSDSIGFLLRNTRANQILRADQWLAPRTGAMNSGNFGLFAGFNYQFDEAVLGFEADYSRVRLSSSGTDQMARRRDDNGTRYTIDASGSVSVEIRDLMTLRARAGYTMGSFLPFVTGGLALANYTTTTYARVDTQDEDLASGDINNQRPRDETRRKRRTGFGLAGGAGVDVSVTENLFIRGEWQYLHFPDLNGANVNLHNFRAGAAVKF